MTDLNRGVPARIARTLFGLLSVACGALAGFLVTLAIVVAKARLGVFIFDVSEIIALRWETVPIVAGVAAGGWLGIRDRRAMVGAMLRGALGMVIGIGLGAAAGSILSDAPEGLWSGMIIGGAAGMVVAGLASLVAPDRAVPRVRSRASS